MTTISGFIHYKDANTKEIFVESVKTDEKIIILNELNGSSEEYKITYGPKPTPDISAIFERIVKRVNSNNNNVLIEPIDTKRKDLITKLNEDSKLNEYITQSNDTNINNLFFMVKTMNINLINFFEKINNTNDLHLLSNIIHINTNKVFFFNFTFKDENPNIITHIDINNSLIGNFQVYDNIQEYMNKVIQFINNNLKEDTSKQKKVEYLLDYVKTNNNAPAVT